MIIKIIALTNRVLLLLLYYFHRIFYKSPFYGSGLQVSYITHPVREKPSTSTVKLKQRPPLLLAKS